MKTPILAKMKMTTDIAPEITTPDHNRVKILTISLAIVFVALISNVRAQSTGAQSQPKTFAERLTYSRAIEAAIWARPLTGVKALIDGLQRDAGVGYNDVGYFSQLQNSKFQWPTTNVNDPVRNRLLERREGRCGRGDSARDAGCQCLRSPGGRLAAPDADVGPDGIDGGRGAKYLLTTPEYRGPVPPGYLMLKQTTYNGYMSLRLVLKDNSAASLQKAVEYVKLIKVYPLSQANNPTIRYVDLYDKKVNLVTRLDANMYRSLHAMIQTERIEERDLVAMGMLHSLGIEKGKPFAPSAGMVAMFDAAAKETQDYLRQEYLFGTAQIYYPGTQWRTSATPGLSETRFTFLYPGYIDIDNRASLYNYNWGTIERLGTSTWYLNLAADAKGQPLDGSRNYRLHVPANAPAS
jgi:hypothetical protein